LCIVRNSKNKVPFPIAFYYHIGKPSCRYFQEFTTDLLTLLTRGFFAEGQQVSYSVIVHSFVCDAPDRAMLKNVKSHTGYFGCDKCDDEGEWHNRMTFQNCNAALRSDTEFATHSDREHHLGPSVLQNLPIGMVSDFPLDYMHLVCLGVVRRLLLIWLKGPLQTRLPASKVDQISARLISFVSYFPRDFSRKPRSLNDVLRWKATEFRTFLLYTGPIALEGILPRDLYENFLQLSVAISILCSPVLSMQLCDYTKELLKTCVENMKVLYGEYMIVYNVHSLVHLPDDVRKLGHLDSFSAFPFENALKGYKTLIRKPNFPLQQLANRLVEKSSSDFQVSVPVRDRNGSVAKKEHSFGPLP